MAQILLKQCMSDLMKKSLVTGNVELKCNEPTLTSDHDTNSKLSKTDDSEHYSEESSVFYDDNSLRKAFYGKNIFKWAAEMDAAINIF